jgi:proteasome lid subunit RPN8/RPN11
MNQASINHVSVRLDMRAYFVLIAHARAAHPDECCGILLGSFGGDDAPGTIDEAVPARNAVAFGAARHFRIEPMDMLATSRAARERDTEIVGFFHSHPAGPPAPSVEDITQSAAWPGYFHLIAAPDGDEGFDIHAYLTGSSRWTDVDII